MSKEDGESRKGGQKSSDSENGEESIISFEMKEEERRISEERRKKVESNSKREKSRQKKIKSPKGKFAKVSRKQRKERGSNPQAQSATA